MALSDLAVYSQYAYATQTELLRQNIELFNAATNGAITLTDMSVQGDYSDRIYWGKVSGLVKRRNAYGSGTVAAKKLANLVETMVKVAASTPPVEIDPGQFKWIQADPELAGVILGEQLAKDTLADMLNTAIGCGYAALAQIPALVYDGTGDSPNTMNPVKLNNGQALFGDAAQQIVCWVMHSKALYDFYGNALNNAQQLFKYDTVNVMADPFGRPFIMTDSPSLVTVGSPNTYRSLGLVRDAIMVGKNNDYTANEDVRNGGENISRTFQAEWSYDLGVKGFQWDKTNGGKSPTDAALLTSTNWDKIATSNKDLAGVIIQTR